MFLRGNVGYGEGDGYGCIGFGFVWVFGCYLEYIVQAGKLEDYNTYECLIRQMV